MSDQLSPRPTRAELGLERYRTRLGFWQAIWGTLISGGIAVAIPAGVDAYKANLNLKTTQAELNLKEKEIESKIIDSHEKYISSFLSTALNQDIELRLRFSEYFSYVSDEKYKEGWNNFYRTLKKRRDEVRKEIIDAELRSNNLEEKKSLSYEESREYATLQATLKWDYAEMGYVKPDTNLITPTATASDALWGIVNEKCVVNQQQHGNPAPCATVNLQAGVKQGYVVLKDLIGETQYLLMPTAKITGIEDPAVLAPDASNYFADAWQERHFTIEAAKRDLPRDDLSLAINSAHGRTQNQLHIHIDCVLPAVKAAVQRRLAQIGDKWGPFPEPLVGHPYRALRVNGDALDANPFRLVADGVPGARAAMGKETVVVIGAIFAGGKPGFVILDATADPATNDQASGEELQDHSCALAKQ